VSPRCSALQVQNATGATVDSTGLTAVIVVAPRRMNLQVTSRTLFSSGTGLHRRSIEYLRMAGEFHPCPLDVTFQATPSVQQTPRSGGGDGEAGGEVVERLVDERLKAFDPRSRGWRW
jgi:hypothetical protein